MTSKQVYGRLIFFSIFVIFLIGAVAVPFYFESMTLWYKVGSDKTLLRIGQLAGMVALVALFLQIILAVKGPVLESLFEVRQLIRLHTANAITIVLLALMHVLFVLIPEGLQNLPIGKKFWPEMIGGLLFCIILGTTVSSAFRKRLQVDYRRWKALHQSFGYLSITLLVVHVIFVSDSFDSYFLAALFLFLAGCLLLWVIVMKILNEFDP